MNALVDLIAALIGSFLAAFVLYDLVFALISLLARMGRQRGSTLAIGARKRFLVLIPAHDEETLIGQLVQSIQQANYESGLVRTVVIADNCSDRTADIARRNGADVLERCDANLRGKPYALNWAIGRLDLAAFDAVVMLDADTVVDRNIFNAFSSALAEGNKVLQGYFGVMNPGENWLTRLSIVPGTLKYVLHNPGKNAVGLSAVLAGNAMCFEAEVLTAHGWSAFSLAENWEYTAILSLAGHRVTSVEGAIIYSQVASSLRAGAPQRTRWHKGRVDVLRRYWRSLLSPTASGWIRNVDLLVEIVKPSHAVLLAVSITYFGLVLFLRHVVGVVGLGAALAFTSFALAGQITFLLAGMVASRAPMRAWVALTMVPFYLCWKMYVTLRGSFRSEALTWTRTKRNEE